MSGTIIEIRRHPGFRKDKRRIATLPQGRSRSRGLDPQIARIMALLDELDGLKGGPEEVPAWLVAEAQARLRRARDTLQPAAAYVGGVPNDSDPQPQVDREILERMYRSLDPQR